MLKMCKVYAGAKGLIGLHLSRAPWDPYPWVSEVERGSSAQRAGIRMGDAVLELNGCDVLGKRIASIAAHIRGHWQSGATHVTLVIWRNTTRDDVDHETETQHEHEHEDEDEEAQQHHGINQQSLQKFATCLQHIGQLLECPVCLEVIRPPGWQCCNGHVLCNNCRSRSVKCPVCRVPLGPRGRCLLSDKLFTLLAEHFPCDGVRSSKNSPIERRKCTPDFHNYPMVASMILQQEEKDEQQRQQSLQTKAKDSRKKVKTQRAKVEDTNGDNHDDGVAQPPQPQPQRTPLTLPPAAIAAILQVAHQRTSRRSSVQQQQQQPQQRFGPGPIRHPEEWKIGKNPNCECPKRLTDCGNAECDAGQAAAMTTATAGTSMLQQETSYVGNNMLVKLKLKSGKKKMPTPTTTTTDYNGIRAQHNDTSGAGGGSVEFTARGKSHELRDDEVAIVNNAMTTNAVQPKPKQQQQQQQQQQHVRQPFEEQQYQNYHCPTGKSCCSYVKTFDTAAERHLTALTMTAATGNNNIFLDNDSNVQHKKLSSRTNEGAAQAAAARIIAVRSTTNDDDNDDNDDDDDAKAQYEDDVDENVDSLSCNKSWTSVARHRGTVTLRPGEAAAGGVEVAAVGGSSQLRCEWQILAHLTQQHRLPVTQLYGTYSQRIYVEFERGKVLPCLNLHRRSTTTTMTTTTTATPNHDDYDHVELKALGGVDKFFVATVPLTLSSPQPQCAIFLWHLPLDTNTHTRTLTRCTFETIIESKRYAVKWFGRAHELSKSWTQIHAEGHYLTMPCAAPLEVVIKIK